MLVIRGAYIRGGLHSGFYGIYTYLTGAGHDFTFDGQGNPPHSGSVCIFKSLV